MKRNLLAAAFIAAVSLHAQSGNVGVNTPQPAATLDVVGQPLDASKLDGIIAPRLTGEHLRAKTYTTAQTGALVYVTAADSAPAGQTINVTAPGYYYFDGTQWVKTGGGNAAPTGNFWNIDGNTGTSLGTNFLGTTDAQPLQFRVNNVQAGLISQFQSNAATPTGGNVALGYNAMPYAGTVQPSQATPIYRQNVAIGWNALSATPTDTMMQNVAVGDRTMQSLVSGGTNIAIGDKAMANAKSGDSNIGIGVDALTSLNGDRASNWGNIAMGYQSGAALTTGRSNILIKNHTAGATFTTGSNNIMIGQDAGQGLVSGGDNNIALGSGANLANSASYQLNIGNTIYGTGLSSANAKIGIIASTTSIPTENFDINGTVRVRALPANGAANAIYTTGTTTTSVTKNQTFTATKTVVADDNGVLGIVSGLPSSGLCNTTKSYTADASNTSPIIDLSAETTPPCLYIINDNTNSSNGYTINITLPANVAGSTGRVIRFISLPTSNSNNSGLKFNGTIGNRTSSSVNSLTISASSVTLGSGNTARHETVISFYEINGKWYLDKIIQKGN